MDKVLQAYAYSILAKDASGRYSNPGRALRNYQDIMAIANPGSGLLEQLMEMVKKKEAPAEVEQTNPVKVDENTTIHTKPQQPQYVTKKDLHYFKNDILKAVKDAIPTPPAP